MLCTLYFRHTIKDFINTYIFIEYPKLLRCESCYPHFIKEANFKHIMGKLAELQTRMCDSQIQILEKKCIFIMTVAYKRI